MNFDKSTPVALFIFNRPKLTAQVFERIRAAQPERLLVIADGPRTARPEEAELCGASRDLVSSPDWPCQLLTSFSNENLGCRRRISSGLDWVFQECPEAIILEDDCLPSASFFEFCSEMLQRYRDDARILHVSGDNFQDGVRRGEASYFFSRYPHTWGWATWSRAWHGYDVDIPDWPVADREHWLEFILDNPREVDYWREIFTRLYQGEIDTWDYQWIFTCWRKGGMSVLPNQNLVTNIGVGPDATHLKEGHSTVGIPAHELGELTHPTDFVRDEEADRYTFERHILGEPPGASSSFLQRVRDNLAVRSRMKRLLQRTTGDH